jgi:peptidoglycan/LPS O-acetylase OafA/YrhL
MMTKEIKALTGMRGIASVYVVLFHFYQYCFFNIKLHEGFLFGEYSSAFFIHGYLAVDVFFVLSAFVITLTSAKLFDGDLSISNYKVFMRKRFIRIYPSYLITALYGYVVVTQFNRTPNFILSLTLLNLFFGLPHILGHLWSLGAEWITYLLYPLFFKISTITRKGFWKYILVLSGILLLYAVGIIWNKNLNPDYLLEVYQGYPALFRCFGDYFIGLGAYFLYKEHSHKFLFSNTTSIVLTTLIIVALCFPKLDLLIITLSTLLILNVSKDSSIIAIILSSRMLYFLGTVSYPLYLINSLIILKPELLVQGTSQIRIVIIGAGFIATCILLATAFTYLVEKPLISLLTKVMETKAKYTL